MARYAVTYFAGLLVTLGFALGCQSGNGGSAADSGARTGGPDTAAIQGAGHAPHPSPAAVDSLVDSTAARRRP